MKDIKGYEGYYSITRNGRVWSHKRKTLYISGRGKVRKTISMKVGGRFLTPSEDSLGYYTVSLLKDGKQSTLRIHRIIAEAFIPTIKGKVNINHKNGIKTDNSIDNLEWCTYSENRFHAVNTGLWKMNNPQSGTKAYNSKLTDEMVREIRRIYPNETLHELGRRYGVSYRTVWDVTSGRHWKHIK